MESLRTGRNSLRLWVRAGQPQNLSDPGVRVESAYGGLAVAAVNPDAIARLIRNPGVKWMESPAECRLLLDKSLPAVGMDRVRPAADTGPTGAGVIVGIVDSGIDWSHPDFIGPDGKSRILFIWDQTDDSGPHPPGTSYGTEITRDRINDEIDGHPAGSISCRDESGHGTHVAGIAAGNGRGTGNGKAAGRYTGMAPEADLIVVKTPTEPIDETRVADGAAYVFSRAGQLGKPAVVNLSVGKSTQEGPHDGTSPLEQAINALLLGTTGRAVVTAAGNDGDRPIHFKGQFDSPVSNSWSVPFSVPANAAGTEDGLRFDVWSPPYTGLTVTVVAPSGASWGPVAPLAPVRTFDTPEGVITVDNASAGADPDNDDCELRIRIADGRTGAAVRDVLAAGGWRLDFTGKPGRFDGWLYESTMGAVLTGGIDYTTLLVEPAQARLAVAVGSFVSRNTWPCLGFTNPYTVIGLTDGAISDFSSGGGCRPNTRGSSPSGKPEIAAPGEYVLSALSSGIAGRPADHLVADDSVHWAQKGTSMSAPHVTGLVALMFEKNPALRSGDVKAFLIAGARKTADMGSSNWHSRWGYGALDAYATLRLSGVEDRPAPAVPAAFDLEPGHPNPFNGTVEFGLTVSASAGSGASFRVRVLDASGRTVRTLRHGRLQAGRSTVRWDGTDDSGRMLPSGVYLLSVSGAGNDAARKVVMIR
jgi:minor extracellular serine protease Vpr